MKKLDIYVTKDCNLGCDYCFVDINKPSQNVFDTENFKNKVNVFEYDEINFFGGEPLLKWDDISPLVIEIREKGGKQAINLLTNGILLSSNIFEKCKNLHIHINISFHQKGFHLIEKKLPLFSQYQDFISCAFIFSNKHIAYPFPIILKLHLLGFRNFILYPEIYTDWDETNILRFKKELNKLLKLVELFPGTTISNTGFNYLKLSPVSCGRNVFDEVGGKKACNRFLYANSNSFQSFNEVISFIKPYFDIESHPLRWFYTCPTGWYYDTILKFGDTPQVLIKRMKQFNILNTTLLDFIRQSDVIQGKINFLTSNITNIRFNMTNQCNLRCNYCYLDFDNEVLSYETGKNIIDFFFAQDSDSKQLSFFGGEPLLCFDTLKKLVSYANEQSRIFKKDITYAIATNFLLINHEILDFLQQNNFEIHISFNGLPDFHNATRDKSFEKLSTQINKYLSFDARKKIVILLGFGPEQVNSLCKSVLFIKKMGFQHIKFEMFLGNQFHWTQEHLDQLDYQIALISRCDIDIYNTKTHTGVSLDIGPDGRCAPTSFEFHNYSVDFQPKQIFNEIIKKYLL